MKDARGMPYYQQLLADIDGEVAPVKAKAEKIAAEAN